MVCFLFLAMIVGGCVYLVISGVRESSRSLLILAYGILLAIVIGAGLMSSSSSYGGMFAFMYAIITAPLAVVGGIVCAFVLEKWHKLHGVWAGILFPLMLFGSVMLGSEFAPESLSVEEQYLKHTEALLDTIQASGQLSNAYYAIEHDPVCMIYLRENLSEYSGQYALKVLASVDPNRDPVPVGSTAALILVEFPGGGQVEISYYNLTAETCKIIDGD